MNRRGRRARPTPRSGARSRACLSVLAALLLRGQGADAAPEPAGLDLSTLSLEELMDVEVSLTARREESLFEAAAAVSVLTADDLGRAGVTSIPEALRLIPGMAVARAAANKWAVSARGFNGVFANKLLVLIDGRSVYTPTFSGVYWEVQDVLLDDVERIEVVRGPGATLWGTNAVNGVVNVVTRAAAETQAPSVHIGGGTEERGFAEGHTGGRWDGGAWRVWGRGFVRDDLVDSTGTRAHDGWAMARGGFRADGTSSGGDAWTLQGDVYGGRAGQTYRFVDLQPPYRRVVDDDTRLRGANLLGRWQRGSGRGRLRARAYYDHTERDDVLLRESRDTADLELQHSQRWHGAHELVWGLGYRYTTNDTRGSFAASLSPPGRGEDVISGFVQGETRHRGGRLRLTVGTKVEHNDHTGFEWQPSARLWWQVARRQAVWTSVSRALRIPSQADEDVRLNLLVMPPDSVYQGSPVAVGAAVGSRDLDPERLTALEAGYRAQPRANLWLDAAAFYNRYRDLRTGRVGLPYIETEPSPTHLVVPYRSVNGLQAETWGLEIAADWRVLPDRWRLRASWSWLHMDLTAVNMSDPRAEDATDENPEHRGWVWSSLDLTRAWQLDAVLRYMGALPYQGFPAYTVADLRLGWAARPGVELELVGRNLLRRRHHEFRAFYVDALPTQTQSEVYLGLRWRPRSL